jgi:hypothetical protein
MGLPNSGFRLRTPKGLWDHLYEVTPLKVKPTVETVGPVDLLDHYSPIEGVHRGDTTHPDRLTWSFTHRKKSPIFLRMDYSDWTGLVMLNGEVIAAFTPGSPVSLKLDHETLNRGKNTLEFAVMGRDAEARDTYKKQASIVALYEGVAAITEKAEWAFAGWEAPAADEFEPIAKSGLSAQAAKRFKGAPVWWSAAFGSVEDPYAVPIRLDCKGLSKGHIVLNGTPTARYWVQTQDGNAVPPESEVWLPPDLLRTEADNQLLIFDEHGFPPSKVAIKVGPLNA